MTSQSFRIFALALALLAAGLVGLTVGASGGAAGSAVSSFLAAHVGGGHHCAHRAMEELGLTAEQRQLFDAIHEKLGSFSAGHAEEHPETLDWFLDRVRQGDLTTAEIRGVVDRHLEEIRTLAYAIGDDVVAVVETLDDEQRELVAGHLEAMHSCHGGQGPGGFLGHFRGHSHGH